MAVKTLSYQEWRKMIARAETSPADHPMPPNGFSPGGAAAELGISRQAVHKAMRKGRLDAIFIPVPGGEQRAGYYLIPPASLKAFKRQRQKRLTS